ncbi:AMP-binding protein [Actinomadura scrupuli]|uniref:AMP-binding protein n=1 Tax=Actinomadura scrupuli TaxID=559629 RepID=UPI003D96480C
MAANPIAHRSTLPGVLEHAATRDPEAPAIIEAAGTLSHREMYAAARDTAAGLVELGVAPGDRVGIWLPNGAEWAIAAYGVSCAGAVAVPLNTRYTVPEAADIIARSGCAVVVADGAPPYGSSRDGIAPYGPAPGPGPGDAAAAAGARTVVGVRGLAGGGTAASAAEVGRRMRALTPDDLSHVQYTSGTTGRPKGALLRHGAMVATTRTWVEITGLRAGDRYPVVAPFSHIGGHKTGLLACAVAGAAALPQVALDVPVLVRAISEHGVTVLQGPPTMYQALLARVAEGAAALPRSVRVAVTGAASVPPGLIRDLRTVLGVRSVFTAYGLTEASGVCTMTRADDEVTAVAETAGRAIPGVRVRIDGPEGPGEILVRGAGLMAGYLDDPEATAEALRDGWLRTGDVGVLDEHGRLRVVDRLKDLVIVGGLNVYPAEVERVLLDHPAIAAAAVVGVPHERLGEVPAAFVVGAQRSPGVPGPSAAEVTAFCRARLAGFKAPRTIWWVGELPLNAAGKVAKAELRIEAARRMRALPAGPAHP